MILSMARAGVAAMGVIAIVFATAATAQATNDPLFDSGSSDDFDVVADDGFGSSDTSIPTDITITGDPGEDLPDEAAALDGTYVISAGGSRQTAVLGAITFDPTGTIVTGTLTIVSAEESSTDPVGIPTVGDGDDFGDDPDPLAPAPTGTANVTDCTATGGSYTLSEGGSGEAQVELDCSGSSLTAAWRLSVIAGDGFGQAQQVRAVQTDPVGEDGITELVLTLR